MALSTALGNALLHGIRYLLKPEVNFNHIIMDKSKLDRAKVKVIGEKIQTATHYIFICIGIDSKIDENTLTYTQMCSNENAAILKKTKKLSIA